MEEKKSGSKVGIFVLVSIVLLGMMGALGYYIYELKQDNKFMKAQAETLQTRVDVLSNAVEKVQEKNDNATNTVNSSEVKNEVNNTAVENQVKKEYFILHHGQEMELKPGTYNYGYGMDVNDENISKYNNKTYYNYSKGKYIGETVGTFEPKNQENYMSVENVEEYAISENYNICPREYKEISIIPDKFNDLKKQGYNIKIHSIDLDNDGKEEKVVCLTNTIGGKAYSEISLYNSDYEEITKLVTIEDGFVADLSKSGKIENAALLSLDLVDYIDVDIDGTIEIIVNHLCYEGSSISIYKYENETVNGPTNGKGYFGA